MIRNQAARMRNGNPRSHLDEPGIPMYTPIAIGQSRHPRALGQVAETAVAQPELLMCGWCAASAIIAPHNSLTEAGGFTKDYFYYNYFTC